MTGSRTAPQAPSGCRVPGSDIPSGGHVVAGVPLGPLPAAAPADELLTTAARRWPGRPAVVHAGTVVTFAELDAAADAWAAALRRLLPGPRRVVAVASSLRAEFVAAFHGVLRSGHVVAPFVPLLREPALVHNLTRVAAAVALVDGEVAERLRGIRGELPLLRHLLDLGAGPPADGVDGDGSGGDGPGMPDDVACLLFTSGTTGAPKAVALSHANLLVNATQVADAHDITDRSVCVNHLPTFHPMHMNSALARGALQVLCPADTFAEAVAVANAHRATHLYSLPARLMRGSADPSFDALELPHGTAIASGGSALTTDVARNLVDRFGVPVLQGYGLAETSPLTHSDGPRSWELGSVGRPVAGTECRLLDPRSGAPLPAGGVGEVQVRGPQVMLGYLGRDGAGRPAVDRAGAVDADGWLSTGDVGRIADDGRLFLVDRLRDVFKCDNWLVAPSEVEAVARTHPAVREAVVVDLPDRFSGAVAAAFVSLHPGSSADGASVRAHVNERVPYYQQLRHVSVTPQIPRSLTGKIERRELRYALIAHHRQGDPMSAEIPQRALQAGLTIVNTFTLKDPGLARTFEQGFLDHVEFMRAQPGFVAHQMIHRTDDPRVYVNVGWWERPDDFQAVRTSPTFVEHAAQFHRWVDVEALPARSLPVARGADLIGTQTDGGMLVLETLIPGGNADRLTAAFAAYVAAAPDADLHWVDLSFGLRESGRYTAISRWSDTAGWERARAMPEYRAVLDLAQVTAAPATSLAASRAVPAGV